MRRAVEGALDDGAEADEDEDAVAEAAITQERYAEMSAAEDLILTITAKGSGQDQLQLRLSAARARRSGRHGHGQGHARRAAGRQLPVERDDQIMLATSTGQSIRVPVDGISFRSRTGGVRVFNTGADETVVSVARIAENGEDEGEEA